MGIGYDRFLDSSQAVCRFFIAIQSSLNAGQFSSTKMSMLAVTASTFMWGAFTFNGLRPSNSPNGVKAVGKDVSVSGMVRFI